MDPVTQGVLGAAAASGAQSFANDNTHGKRTDWRVIALLGGLAGMAPDLDILIQSSRDPLIYLEYHRHFTHALIFIPVGALLVSMVLWPFVRRKISFSTAYWYCLIGYATHGLLDACTSYGTQLFWPFSDLRVAWNNVSVIDPLVTVPMLAALIVGWVRRSVFWPRLAVGWMLAYLIFGAVQHARALDLASDLATARGHEPTRITAKPSFANLFAWKLIYEFEERFYVDAAHVGVGSRFYEGTHIDRFQIERDMGWLDPMSVQASDIDRFSWFSDGWIALDPNDPLRIIDIRYSMVPDEINALWGIHLDRDAPPDQHADFVSTRARPTADDRARFWGMIVGE